MLIIFINKKTLYIFLIILVCISTIFITNKNSSKTSSNMPVTNKVILLDAGHGGQDAGAVGKNNTLEKDINLKIASKLRSLLEESGALVIITREKDENLLDNDKYIYKETLKNRKKMIHDSKCDIFVSIHLNSFESKNCKGAQTFYYKNDEESKKLAIYIQEELKRVLNKDNNRIAKPRSDIYVLKKNEIPSVLIECGFLSNQEEEDLLNSDDYQEKISWAIYLGIQKYFNIKS